MVQSRAPGVGMELQELVWELRRDHAGHCPAGRQMVICAHAKNHQQAPKTAFVTDLSHCQGKKPAFSIAMQGTRLRGSSPGTAVWPEEQQPGMGRSSWVPIPPHSPSLSPQATPPPPDPNRDQQTGFPVGCRGLGGTSTKQIPAARKAPAPH